MTLSLCATRAPVSLSCSLLASIGRPLALPVLAVCLGLGAGPVMAQTADDVGASGHRERAGGPVWIPVARAKGGIQNVGVVALGLSPNISDQA